MRLRFKKFGTTEALLALCLSIGLTSVKESIGATLTIEFDVNIQSFTDYVSNTTTSYESPLRHGSISFSLANPYSFALTFPVVAADPGPFTITAFSPPVTFTSPIPELINASYYVKQFGNTSTRAEIDRAHRASDNTWDSFSARLSSGSSVGLVSSSYNQILTLRKPWGDFVTSGADPYAVSANALVDYLREASMSSEFLQFSEGFSVYDVMKLRYVEGTSFSGSGQITNVLVDNVSVRSNIPEPASVALFGIGLLGFAASRRKSAKSKSA